MRVCVCIYMCVCACAPVYVCVSMSYGNMNAHMLPYNTQETHRDTEERTLSE